MHLLTNVLVTIGATGVSIIASLWIARHYYFRLHPERTSALALAMAARGTQRHGGRRTEHPSADNAPDESERVGFRWALELIDAFEGGKIYLPELLVCAKTMNYVGNILAEPMRAANQAGSQHYTTSPQWSEARREAFHKELAQVREDLRAKLNTS